MAVACKLKRHSRHGRTQLAALTTLRSVQRPIEGDDSATTAPRANAAPATGGHVFAQDLQDVCKGEAVPPDAVAVMRSSDGRNGSSKKQPYLAFLVPERGRYLWMRSWEAWGLRKCSLCGAAPRTPPCAHTARPCGAC